MRGLASNKGKSWITVQLSWSSSVSPVAAGMSPLAIQGEPGGTPPHPLWDHNAKFTKSLGFLLLVALKRMLEKLIAEVCRYLSVPREPEACRIRKPPN